MKYLYIITLVTLVSVSPVKGAEQDIHLFILSGQSNMAALDPNVSFTPTIIKAFGKDNVIVVKDAEGGQPIRRWYKEWRSEKGIKPRTTGELYDRLMTKVNASIDRNRIETVTFVWMQGERDAIDKHGNVYADSLKGLANQLKADLERMEINVVIGRINDFAMNKKIYPHWTIVRKAQVDVAESLPHAAWVNTDDLNGRKNGIHATKEGYKILGKRFANKAIELINK